VVQKKGELPSGLKMMMKAFGVEFDPQMFQTMQAAVVEIRDTLRRIDSNTKAKYYFSPTPPLTPEAFAHLAKVFVEQFTEGHRGVKRSPDLADWREFYGEHFAGKEKENGEGSGNRITGSRLIEEKNGAVSGGGGGEVRRTGGARD
jgi:hypothetical protein